jgi:hypothetical protein
MLSPVLRREVSVGEAMVMRVAPSVGVMARRVPVVSIKPVNIITGYSSPFSVVSSQWLTRPGVVEVAGDAGVGTIGSSGDAVEEPLEEVGGGDALREGKGLIAKLRFSVEEDGFVGQVLAKEGAVEVRAAFEEEAEDVALGEGGEDCGKAKASGVIGDLVDLDAERAEGGGL